MADRVGQVGQVGRAVQAVLEMVRFKWCSRAWEPALRAPVAEVAVVVDEADPAVVPVVVPVAVDAEAQADREASHRPL